MTTVTLKRRLLKTPVRDLIRGRVTGRLDIDVLLDASALSTEAADKVRRVVKGTRLKRLEKVDVANELIAHFQDGIEAETPLEELLNSFGDEKQTAKLIRRAKKRQRPIAWHIFAWTRLTVVCFLGFYILSALYLLTGTPTIKTNYLALINKQANQVPEDEAAWPLYRKAMLELNLWQVREWDTPIPYYAELPEEEQEDNWDYLQPPFRHSRWVRLSPSLTPGNPGWGETETFLLEHQNAFALIRKAAAMPGLGRSICFFEDLSQDDIKALNAQKKNFEPRINLAGESSLLNASQPHLWVLPSLSRLLSTEAARNAKEGDNTSAYQNTRAMLQMLHQANELPTMQNGGVVYVLNYIAYTNIQNLLTEYPDLFTDAQLQDLAHVVSSTTIDPERWFIGERLAFYDTLQRIYTDDGKGNGRVTREGINSLSVEMPYDSYDVFGNNTLVNTGLPIAVWMIAPREEIKQTYDQLLDKALNHINQPMWELDPQQAFEDPYDHLITDYQTAVRYALIRSLYPDTAWAYEMSQSIKGLRQGVMIGIALEVYRRDHGQLPDSLDELTPTYLPKPAQDPFTGGPMGYVRTEQHLIIYSVGVDGDDDGGQPPWMKSGEPANWYASPSHFGLSSEERLKPTFDGDWVLWPQPGM